MVMNPFRRRKDPYALAVRAVLLGCDTVGYLGCCAALRDFDGTDSLPQIRVPTLVIAGDRYSPHSRDGRAQPMVPLNLTATGDRHRTDLALDRFAELLKQ